NAPRFLAKAERTLGFPIDVITGYEEARLIYLGVAHLLPASDQRRLVIDIGGGSTEFIIGRTLTADRLASLPIGCVNMTQRFFRDGKLSADAFEAAETAARTEVEAIAASFGSDAWDVAYASSGTALALAEILESNGLSQGGITPDGLSRLRARMIAAGDAKRLNLAALKTPRATVLAGGLAVMSAALSELDARQINPVGGALRLGVLYDLLGRTEHQDARTATIEQFLARYHVDRAHAGRVASLAVDLYRRATHGADAVSSERLEWAALVHEIGISVSHTGFHKHGAYILEHAEMPGFSAREQAVLARLVLGCRGGLSKLGDALEDGNFRAMLFALRLAVLFHHSRRALDLPRLTVRVGEEVEFAVSAGWLKAHPLSNHLLERERDEWADAGYPWRAAT
ncbi:MAG: Ppx/GppA phosphatase family protein, partial [Betaproteobacteria bacterium]